MYSFKNDYSEGGHPRILAALADSNMAQEEGYGADRFTQEAIRLIRAKIQRQDADIHLISGGTQTNLIAISAFLRPHEAVISADTGHILVHETGAIEATGHKAISVASPDGKLTVPMVEACVRSHTDEHMVKPRMVYISDTTEIGTHYTLAELEELSAYCRKHNLIFYMDGARLGSALTVENGDVTLADLGRLMDAFYIGGTKNGALLGEALVLCRDDLKGEFRFHIKQKGALMAKGRILGIQFRELFRDELFFELARHGNQAAAKLRQGIEAAGFSFMIPSESNQIFPVLPDKLIQSLQEDYLFYVWQPMEDGYSAVRLVTSWATEDKAVEGFGRRLKEFPKGK